MTEQEKKKEKEENREYKGSDTLRNFFIRRRKLYLDFPGANFVFDTQTGLRRVGTIHDLSHPVPISEDTVFATSFGFRNSYLLDLESGKIKGSGYFDVGVCQSPTVVIDDWLYHPYVYLARTKKDLTLRQESSQQIDAKLDGAAGATQMKGKIATVYVQQTHGGNYSPLVFTYHFVLWDTSGASGAEGSPRPEDQDPNSMKILKTFGPLLAPTKSPEFWMKKVDESHLLVGNKEEIVIWNIETQKRFSSGINLTAWTIRDLDLIPRSSVEGLKSAPVVFMVKSGCGLEVFAIHLEMKEVVSGSSGSPAKSSGRKETLTRNFRVTEMYGASEVPAFGRVRLLDDHHVFAVASTGDYQLLWFDINSQQKKLLSSGILAYIINEVRDFPPSKREEKEDSLRLRKELESQGIPIPRDLLEVIVKFI